MASLTQLSIQYGPLVTFVWVFAESAGIPLAGCDIGVVTVAALSGSHAIAPVAAMGVVGAVGGGAAGFMFGRRYGRSFLRRIAARLRVAEHRIERFEVAFVTHGRKTVFIARWVAVLRVVCSPLAGSSGMPWGRFMLWNAIGSAVWMAALTVGGVLAGASYPAVAHAVGTAGQLIVGAAFVAGIIALIVRRRSSSAAEA